MKIQTYSPILEAHRSLEGVERSEVRAAFEKSLFKTFGADIDQLARAAGLVRLKPGDQVFAEGQGSDGYIYVVVRGALDVQSRGESISELVPGQVGGINLLAGETTRQATLIATEPTVVARIPALVITVTLGSQPEFRKHVAELKKARASLAR